MLVDTGMTQQDNGNCNAEGVLGQCSTALQFLPTPKVRRLGGRRFKRVPVDSTSYEATPNAGERLQAYLS